MTFFLRSGSSYTPTNEDDLIFDKILPPGNFIVVKPMIGPMFFQKVEDFAPIKKIYGDATKNADRIFNTFEKRSNNTGVLLTGEKGSGKSLLAKLLSIMGRKKNMPTILINQDFAGDEFNTLMQSIDQPAIVILDEFEKVYPSNKQEQVLTLLDGVYSSQKLFIVTCNDSWRVNEYMHNRPSRMFYSIAFNGLDRAFIVDYCNDALNDKQYTESICRVAQSFDHFNFDMLQALVEEMNRYDESPIQALKMLNAKPKASGMTYAVNLIVNGNVIPEHMIGRKIWHSSPLVGNDFGIGYADETSKNNGTNRIIGEIGSFQKSSGKAYDFGEDACIDSSFEPESSGNGNIALFKQSDLVSVDGVTGTITYMNSKMEKVEFKRITQSAFSWDQGAF